MATQTIPASATPTADTNKQSQVRIQLSTRQPGIALPKNPGPIIVNTSLRRYALSTLVNTLLQTPKPIPFDFIVNGRILRTSIHQYIIANGISCETVINVEYARAIFPPLYRASFQHEDWVSSVDVLSETSSAALWAGQVDVRPPGQERVLSGSFDGLLRVWNMSSNILATSPSPVNGGHRACIIAAKFISPVQLASSGYDRTIRIWKYSEDSEGFSASITPQIELYGHTARVGSLAVHQPSRRMLSASSDTYVRLWSTQKWDAPEAPASLVPSATSGSNKRRKTGPATSTPRRGPLSKLESHTQTVSGTIFAPNDHTVGYSTSWDNSLKTWDLTTSDCVDTRTTPAALFSLAALPACNALAAGSERDIMLIDPRASATTVSAMTLRGHVNGVVSLAFYSESSYGLVSGSHDGECRVWDVRMNKSGNRGSIGESMYCIKREALKGEKRRVAGDGVKVFGVCWDKSVGIVSASEDKTVQINRGDQGDGIVTEKPSSV